MTTFAERVGLLLYENRMNKSELARRLDLAVSTVHRWFGRDSIPDYSTIMKVAEMFGVSDKWLVGQSDERERPTEITAEPETKKEDELDEELVRLIKGLTPAQIQRVRDFLSGLRG